VFRRVLDASYAQEMPSSLEGGEKESLPGGVAPQMTPRTETLSYAPQIIFI
jgi:hypothetical protein